MAIFKQLLIENSSENLGIIIHLFWATLTFEKLLSHTKMRQSLKELGYKQNFTFQWAQ